MDMSSKHQLPAIAHTSRPWRIHELTEDFDLEDDWELPTPGGPEDFPVLLRGARSIDPAESSHRAVRALFALRWKIGGLLGWDDEGSGLESRVPTLRDRLPADLAGSAPVLNAALPFRPLYLTENEYAAEIANRTVHGVIHLGWVPSPDGGYCGQMAVLVKRNGLFGAAYMKAIEPFRHLIVYPAIIGEVEREWPKRLDELRSAG
jgi:hypothetical protein